jgi:hypothetical protein
VDVQELLRVVTLRKGKLKPVEFRLRDGDRGLSLFARCADPDYAEVIEAVRAAGKQGELVAGVVSVGELQKLGLRIVQTPGNTPVPAVNAIHYEATLPWLRGLLTGFRGKTPVEFFNEHLSPRIAALARILE